MPKNGNNISPGIRNYRSSMMALMLVFLFTSCNQSQLPAVASMQGILQGQNTNAFPNPDHIVLVILENHAYSEIIGSERAPFINALLKDSFTANFTRSYSIEHPSQPNYLALYSGDAQGISDDFHPPKEPFTTPNLGAQLIAAGKSFVTYAEGLPFAGFNGDIYGTYVRKHNPAANWMGMGKNQIPLSTVQPFSAFPSDYNKLPTVSFIIPDLINDMHEGAIEAGDAWIRKNLGGYIQWAKTHNSLFILTFDEEYFESNDHVATIFCGAMVKGGQYKIRINHYTVLATIEKIYGLPTAGHATKAKPIHFCWR